MSKWVTDISNFRTKIFKQELCQWRVARNLQWEGADLGIQRQIGVCGRSPQVPEANEGLGAEPPGAGGTGGSGAELPKAGNFCCFLKEMSHF